MTPPKPRGKVPGRVYVVLSVSGRPLEAFSLRRDAMTWRGFGEEVVAYVPAGRAAVDSKGGREP